MVLIFVFINEDCVKMTVIRNNLGSFSVPIGAGIGSGLKSKIIKNFCLDRPNHRIFMLLIL